MKHLPFLLCVLYPAFGRLCKFASLFIIAAIAAGQCVLCDKLLAADKFAYPTIAAEKTLPGEGALRRYEGLVKRWPEFRAAWAEQIEADQGAVVFLGDSITQGWGKDFKGKFPGLKLANRGIGGDTTRGMLIRLEQDVLSLNPSAIVMLMGTNDIEVDIPPAAIGRNFTSILRAIKKHDPKVPIVLCRMFPSSATKNRPKETIDAVNALFDAAVRDDPQVTVVDTWTLFADANGDMLPAYSKDLLHLNPAGYERWARALQPLFSRLNLVDIAAMEKVADLALVPPVPNTSPLPKYAYDRLDYGMTIGIERTPGGRLWACWVAGGDSPKAYFVLATSDNDGDSWSDPRLVLDSHSKTLPMDRSILVGNLWTDPLGRLWLIFDQSMHMFDGRAGVWATLCENPDADAPTWSPPTRIWHGVTLNKPTVLSTGEWMLPISLDQRPGFGPFAGCFKNLDPLRGANVFVSSDHGATWARRGAATFPDPDWHEHMIVERRDHSLWMLARTRKGIMETTSTDGGRTWIDPTPSKIAHPAARFHIRRLASGNLLLVKHGDRIDAHEGRVQLSAWLSPDDGATWKGGLVLDERKGISYPDGFQAPDGTIYISYDRNRAKDGEILLARFTETDILAKKFAGPRSKQKILISRPLAPKKKDPPE